MKKIFIFLVLAACVLAVSACESNLPDYDDYDIDNCWFTGYIYDIQSGESLRDAHVVMYTFSSGEYIADAWTDRSGWFEFLFMWSDFYLFNVPRSPSYIETNLYVFVEDYLEDQEIALMSSDYIEGMLNGHDYDPNKGLLMVETITPWYSGISGVSAATSPASGETGYLGPDGNVDWTLSSTSEMGIAVFNGMEPGGYAINAEGGGESFSTFRDVYVTVYPGSVTLVYYFPDRYM